MIVKRSPQKITSKYGKRKGFKRFHKGIDLRSFTDDFTEKLPIVLPEPCVFLREVWQDEWGWTYVFKPLVSPYSELKFTHLGNTSMVIGETYSAGDKIGFTMRTDYMISKGYGAHLHFETWIPKPKSSKIIHSNPVIYMDILGIDFV